MKHKKSKARKEPINLREGQRVALVITARSEMGFAADINGTHKGILYRNEVFRPVTVGMEIDGFIKKVRDDQRIDLTLQEPGRRAVDDLSQKILDLLKQSEGSIAVNDKSRPKVIADLFGVSKKAFKRSIGALYKRRMITLEKEGIRLREGKQSSRKPPT